MIEQSDDVLDHRVVAIVGRIMGPRRKTVTTRVGGDDAPIGGHKSRDNARRDPVATVVRCESVQQPDDTSGTLIEVRDVGSVI